MDTDKAQRAACPRCGTPGSPAGHGYTSNGYACPPVDVVAALREELATVTAERDALRGALHEATGLLEQLDAYHPAGDCDSCAMIRAALGGERRPTGAEMERDALVTARAEEREACARMCDEAATLTGSGLARGLADQIRARGGV